MDRIGNCVLVMSHASTTYFFVEKNSRRHIRRFKAGRGRTGGNRKTKVDVCYCPGRDCSGIVLLPPSLPFVDVFVPIRSNSHKFPPTQLLRWLVICLDDTALCGLSSFLNLPNHSVICWFVFMFMCVCWECY